MQHQQHTGIATASNIISAIIRAVKVYHATLMGSAVFICIVPKLSANFNYFLPAMTKSTNKRRRHVVTDNCEFVML